jgi:hypothetical protein
MLEPNARSSLVDLLRPPDGFRLDAAVGTTYSLDYLALTAVVLGLIDGSVDDSDTLKEPGEVLRAITGLADRVRILVDRTHISGNGVDKAPKVLSLYDAMTGDVRLEHASFHPKVWALRYVPRKTAALRDRRPVVRLVCSSRNLTTAENWDLFVCFEGEQGQRDLKRGVGPEAAAFVDALAAEDKAGPRDVHTRVASALRRTAFACPREMDGAGHFRWHLSGPETLDARRPKRGTRALVVSPFVTAGFLRGILDGFDTVQLITSQQQLDEITDDELHQRLAQQDVFVVGSDSHESEEFASLDLHAKLFSFETPSGTCTFLGSANASDRAWLRNSEAIIEMRPGVPPAHCMKRFCFDDNNNLNGWLSPYTRAERAKTPEERAGDAIDAARLAIAGLSLTVRYARRSRDLIVKAARIPIELPAGVAVRVWPMSLCDRKGLGVPLDGIFTGARFADASIADLSELVVFEVSTSRPQVRRTFVLKAEVKAKGWRDARNEAVLRDAVTREAFVQFLRNILFDAGGPTTPPPAGDSEGGKSHRSAKAPSLLASLSIEDVLKQCTQDQSRVPEVQRLLDAFTRTDYVDAAFRVFWRQFIAAWTKSGMTEAR